ncbi:type VI secretion system baseplate subunit TssE [Erwinia sorbitola]|uniref:Type VI secretion system baseplate subunit TssE n=1 Tax=Erwinia sorbitola TaxID=2681984 RepID=A0A6I6E7U4_9GAMM|nr:GPW/gp25 family protein [Erwinia sorbitola]MTD28158.1 type VI secretion system baseplate subunit TssE [Erwinia sorbitola]QGU85847.1 type VI secretion system baseplate subunit TssE [Erwinia sorbitola]
MERKRQFLPTLLERLQDDEPKQSRESYDAFFFDSRMMRSIIQKDLATMLNNTNIEESLDENKHQQVAESVVNYGVRALVGNHASQHKWHAIEMNIRTAILRFESRIIPESLVVRSLLSEDHPSRNGMILFEIRGLIDWSPHPIDLCFHGHYDIETSHTELKNI